MDSRASAFYLPHMSLIASLLAVLFGLPCWELFIILLRDGAGPFGGVGALEALVALGPLAFMLPWAVRLMCEESPAGALWVVAVSPIVCVVQAFAVFALALLLGTGSPFEEPTLAATAAVGTGLWGFIGYKVLSRQSKPRPEEPGSAADA